MTPPCSRCGGQAAFVVTVHPHLRGGRDDGRRDLCPGCAVTAIERRQTQQVIDGLAVWPRAG